MQQHIKNVTDSADVVENNYIHIQSVQKVWKHPNENVTHNFRKKSKDRSISVLKKISADIFFLIFSMTLKKLL
jgi:hypothetical protein